MRIFISWSGQRSKVVAELLNDWIKCVLQATQPWISTKHIDRGALWFTEINDQLKDTTVGIVCLTQENKGRPWILFEAGALAKGLSTNRVCTVLVDLTPTDLLDPLAQFNHTLPNEQGMRDLVMTLNSCLGAGALDTRIAEMVFVKYWPQFEADFAAALAATESLAPPAAPRTESNLLEEILENTRSLNRRLRELESSNALDRKLKMRVPLGPEVKPSIAALIDRLVAAGLPYTDISLQLRDTVGLADKDISAALTDHMRRTSDLSPRGNEGKYD